MSNSGKDTGANEVLLCVLLGWTGLCIAMTIGAIRHNPATTTEEGIVMAGIFAVIYGFGLGVMAAIKLILRK